MSLAERLRAVEERIAGACRQAGRDRDEVRLLPVTKTLPSSVLRDAYALGLTELAENRVQELTAKAADLSDLDVRWVVIGHLQRNKAGAVVDLAAELQSLDSLALAEVLDRRLQAAGRGMDVLVQVNTSGEATKSGLHPDDVLTFTESLRPHTGLRPRGLMTVAAPGAEPAAACFRLLADLRARLQDRDGGGWGELSMGMSGDLDQAVTHGATCVRIGSAIFGARA